MCQCEAPAALPAPRNLGYPTDFHEQYVAGWRLGRGTAGAVYTAVRRADGRKLAVKCVAKVPEDPEAAASAKARAEHLRLIALEVDILRELAGAPGVCAFEAAFEDADKVYLVMELCKGGSLATKRSSFREREVARYMTGVLAAVARCHAAGVLHRDVKPDNFLFTSKDRKAALKIIDFGIAARCDPLAGPFPIEDLGYPCGTLFYMAPEVTRAQWWPVSDVWAAGVMAAQMLTGAFPFTDAETPDAPDAGRTFRAIRRQELDQTGPEWAGVSPGAADFVRHLLIKEPRHRPTAEQALRHPFLASADGASAASSLASSANVSLEPGEELPWLGAGGGSGPVEAATLAQRLQRFALSAGQSSASLSSMSMSSPNASFDPTRDELPLAPPTPGEGVEPPVARSGIFSRLRRLTRRASVKAH